MVVSDYAAAKAEIIPSHNSQVSIDNSNARSPSRLNRSENYSKKRKSALQGAPKRSPISMGAVGKK